MSQHENNNMGKYYYSASAEDFRKIPGNPIAYWVSSKVISIFELHRQIYEISISEGQNITANNDKYLRLCWEVDKRKVETAGKWSFYSKGGSYRKWFGNLDYVVDWSDEARANYHKHSSARIIPEYLQFREGITWTLITSSHQSFRYLPDYATFDKGGSSIFFKNSINLKKSLLFLNTKISAFLTKLYNATLNLQVDDVRKLPLSPELVEFNEELYFGLINIAKSDWDSSETSWGFSRLPLIEVSREDGSKLKSAAILYKAYEALKSQWNQTTLKMQSLEEHNNQVFINAYGLQDELTAKVPLNEITLTCNPYYRYGDNLTIQEREKRQQSETMAELISYAIGCMMGRYSLDREGLVYAHADNKDFKTLVEEGAYTSFPADSDGILPLTAETWFEDDIAARVVEFVRIVWGVEHLEENLQFIADSLCLAAIKPVKKGGETSRETIRRYLSTQFFKDHLKTYKKRPIYWLFSSGKEKAFESLVYLHRYNETTLPRMRTEYVTPLLGQMDSRIDRLRLQQNEAETAEAKRIGKEIDSLTKQLTELRSFDDQLKHYADMKIQLDLDDGVKVNYGKFGTLLAEVKTITGDKAE